MNEKPFSISTASGLVVDLSCPDPGCIELFDVATHLSRACRFGGAVDYSVAEHSVLVALMLEERSEPALTCLAGILHDGHETYVGDIMSPVKRAVMHESQAVKDSFRAITDRLDDAIAKSLIGAGHGKLLFRRQEILDADDDMLQIEQKTLFPSCPYKMWSSYRVLDDEYVREWGSRIGTLVAPVARDKFVRNYYRLKG